jgi:HAMP domain-containing protein
VETPIAVALIALGAALISGFFTWRTSGRANDRTADLAWAKELRQDAADARSEVQQLRDEVRNLRRQLELAQREADYWIAEHQTIRRQAHRPGMTLDRLRELLDPAEPPPAAASR